jgi:hypothetical protein
MVWFYHKTAGSDLFLKRYGDRVKLIETAWSDPFVSRVV